MKKVVYTFLLLLYVALTVSAKTNDQLLPENEAVKVNETTAEVLPQSVDQTIAESVPGSEVITEVNRLENDFIKTEITTESIIMDTTRVKSQNGGDQIVIKKGRYCYRDKILTNQELGYLLKSDLQSAYSYKKSKSLGTTATILQVITQVGITTATGFTTIGILLGAAGGLVIALPLALSADKKMQESINIFNSKHSAVIQTDSIQKSSVNELLEMEKNKPVETPKKVTFNVDSTNVGG